MTLQDKIKLKIAQGLAVKGVLNAATDFVLAVREHGGWQKRKSGELGGTTILELCSREFAKLEQAVDHLKKTGTPIDG